MIRRISFVSLEVLFAAFLTISASGCGDDLPQGTVRQATTLTETPANVLEAAKRALPGVTFQDVWKNVDGRSRALHSYEIRGRAENGKVREVRVSTAGQILEME